MLSILGAGTWVCLFRLAGDTFAAPNRRDPASRASLSFIAACGSVRKARNAGGACARRPS